jgi:hypothetical protein
MINFCTGVLKYAALVLLVLVLSHIVEVKGVSISRHVEHALNSVTSFSPKQEATKMGRELSANIQSHVLQLKAVENSEFTDEDQQQLDELIRKSQQKKASQ